MQEIPIAEFCRQNSQNKAAEIIGCSQSAVSQMLRAKRKIFIVQMDDGTYAAREIRKPNSKKVA